MKTIKYISFALVIALSSCVTGNDESAVLREHEEALAKTPKVVDITVNGESKSRDTQSVWNYFYVNPGDVVSIKATFDSGNGASSSLFSIFRQYYGVVYAQEDAKPVEPLTEIDFEYGAGMNDFSLEYTVHNIITIKFVAINDLGGAGYEDVILEFAEE